MLPAIEIEITADPSSAEVGFKKIEKAQSSLEAATRQYQAQLAKLDAAEKSGIATKDQTRAALDRIEKEYGESARAAAQYVGATARVKAGAVAAGNAAQVMGAQMQSSSFHTANLAAQFNDIGVMLAAGQSPLMLAVQQGTQINQVFAQMGGSTTQKIKGMAAAITSMISPMSLATLGIIAGTAALAQWAMGMLSAKEETEGFADALVVAEERIVAMKAELRTIRTGLSAEELTLVDEVRKKQEAVADAQERLNRARGNSIRGARNNLAVARDELAVAQQKLAEYRKIDDALAAAQEGQRTLTSLIRDAVDALNAAHDAAPKGGWLAGAISDAQALAGSLWEAASAAAAVNMMEAEASRGPVIGSDDWDRFQREDFGQQIRAQSAWQPPVRKSARGGGGKSSGGSAAQGNPRIEALLQELKTEREILEEWRIESVELLNSANATELEAIGGHNEAKLRLEREYQDRLAGIKGNSQDQQLKDFSGFLGSMATALQSGGQKSLKAVQIFAAAQGLINSYLAFTEVIKDPAFIGRPWARIAAGVGILGAGFNMVNAIKGVSTSGAGAASAAAATTATSAASGSTGATGSTTNISLVGDTFSRASVQELLTEALQGEIDRGGRLVFS